MGGESKRPPLEKRLAGGLCVQLPIALPGRLSSGRQKKRSRLCVEFRGGCRERFSSVVFRSLQIRCACATLGRRPSPAHLLLATGARASAFTSCLSFTLRPTLCRELASATEERSRPSVVVFSFGAATAPLRLSLLKFCFAGVAGGGGQGAGKPFSPGGVSRPS